MEASPDLESFRRIRPLTDADGECADDAGEGSARGDASGRSLASVFPRFTYGFT